MRSQRGFTLIELLVVIGIIGLLSAIVLVGLVGAKRWARDEAVKLAMGQMLLAAEVYYNRWASYTDVLADAAFLAAETQALNNNGNIPLTKNAGATGYCAQSTLPGGGSWCVDSTIYAGSTAVCDATLDCATD